MRIFKQLNFCVTYICVACETKSSVKIWSCSKFSGGSPNFRQCLTRNPERPRKQRWVPMISLGFTTMGGRVLPVGLRAMGDPGRYVFSGIRTLYTPVAVLLSSSNGRRERSSTLLSTVLTIWGADIPQYCTISTKCSLFLDFRRPR
jgi:hypothetical protein